MSKVTTLIILFLAATPPAAAHNAGNHAGHDTWTLDPYIVVPLAITGVLFVIGALRLWRRSSTAHPVIVWRSLAFAAGWITLAGALVSPLHWLAERAFTFHMIARVKRWSRPQSAAPNALLMPAAPPHATLLLSPS